MSIDGKKILGVEWLGQCYDAVVLDPLSLNQSFMAQGRVFHVSADGPADEEVEGYRVPVGVMLHSTPRTEILTTKHVIYDAYDYRSKMSRDIGANASFEGLFEFSASASSKAAEDKTASGNKVMKYSMMTRMHQRVRLRETADPTCEQELDASRLKPLMSQIFAAAVRKLPNSESEVYERFIGSFGTHFLMEVTLGGVAYEELLIDEAEISEGRLSESALEVIAKAGLDGFEAGMTAKEATEEARKKQAQYKLERSEIKFIGGKGGTELQSSWIAEVDEEPSPIFPNSRFARLTAALTRGFFPDDEQIETKRQLLDDAIDLHIIRMGSEAGRFVRFDDKCELTNTTNTSKAAFEAINSKNLMQKPTPTYLAKLSLEPAADDDHTGTIVYTGRARPVRIRVEDSRGDHGYLERSAEPGNGGPPHTTYATYATKTPDPERSRWFLLPGMNRPGLHPLVRGEPVAICSLLAGKMLPVGTYASGGFWYVSGTEYPDPLKLCFRALPDPENVIE